MSFAPVFPHDPIEGIADDLFVARGSMRMNPLVRISRNMVILRRGGEPTLINPVRLSEAELGRLEGLGSVKHIMRLGAFHGLDDGFYVARYGAVFWCQEGGSAYAEPPIDHPLGEETDLPFDQARLFCFRETKQPECALLLTAGEGLLLTCDAIQHYGDYSDHSFVARLMMPFIGFPKGTVIGPFWLKFVTPEGVSLRGEFERLLELRFDALFAAHGTLLRSGARAAVRKAVAKAFPD